MTDNPNVLAAPIDTALDSLIRTIVHEVAKDLLTTAHFEETLKTLPTRSEMEVFVDTQLKAHTDKERQYNRQMIDRENEVTTNILTKYREDMERHFTTWDGFAATIGGHGTQLGDLTLAFREMRGELTSFLTTQRERLESVTRSQDKQAEQFEALQKENSDLNTRIVQHHNTIFGDATAQNAPPNIIQTLNEMSRRLSLVPGQTIAAIDRKLEPIQKVIDYVAKQQQRDERRRATIDWVWEFISSKKGAGFVAGISGSAALVIEFFKAVFH